MTMHCFCSVGACRCASNPKDDNDDKEHFGVEALKQTLVDGIEDANNVQRNRQRVEAMKRGVPLKEQLGRVVNVGKKIADRSRNE